jgi:hypothetical protein
MADQDGQDEGKAGDQPESDAANAAGKEQQQPSTDAGKPAPEGD